MHKYVALMNELEDMIEDKSFQEGDRLPFHPRAGHTFQGKQKHGHQGVERAGKTAPHLFSAEKRLLRREKNESAAQLRKGCNRFRSIRS